MPVIEKVGDAGYEISQHLRDMDRPGKLVSQSPGLPPLDSDHCNALTRLLSRAWFRRLWVIQEVAVSQAAKAYCDEHEIDFVCLELAGAWLARNNVQSQAGNEGFRWADNLTLMIRFANREAMSVLASDPLPLLWMIRDFEATDARDKVFATLSLTFNNDMRRLLPDVFIPDYTQGTETMYRELVRYLIRKNRDLDALCMVQPFRRSVKAPCEFPAYHPLKSLPAPAEFAFLIARWDYGFGYGKSGPLGLFPEPQEGDRPLYLANGRIPLSTITLKDPTEPNSLLVRGLKLDRITSVSECI